MRVKLPVGDREGTEQINVSIVSVPWFSAISTTSVDSQGRLERKYDPTEHDGKDGRQGSQLRQLVLEGLGV